MPRSSTWRRPNANRNSNANPNSDPNPNPNYVAQELGRQYEEAPPFSIEALHQETSASIVTVFVLLPGATPWDAVEALGAKFGLTEVNGLLQRVSLGQGQEAFAIERFGSLARRGGWIFYENGHLMSKWLPQLEFALEGSSGTAHPNFRTFLTLEAPNPYL